MPHNHGVFHLMFKTMYYDSKLTISLSKCSWYDENLPKQYYVSHACAMHNFVSSKSQTVLSNYYRYNHFARLPSSVTRWLLFTSAHVIKNHLHSLWPCVNIGAGNDLTPVMYQAISWPEPMLTRVLSYRWNMESVLLAQYHELVSYGCDAQNA